MAKVYHVTMRTPKWFFILYLVINEITPIHFMLCATLYAAGLYYLGEWHASLVFFFTMVLVLGTVGVLKVMTQVERPKHALVKMKNSRHAFPSGHASAAAFVAVMVPYTAPWGYTVLTTSLFLVFACMVGLSRLVLGVHTKPQVVAGFLVGALLPYLAIWYIDPAVTNTVLNML